MILKMIVVSVSSRSSLISYNPVEFLENCARCLEFPSPFGVHSFLIRVNKLDSSFVKEFLSPLGVHLFLIF